MNDFLKRFLPAALVLALLLALGACTAKTEQSAARQADEPAAGQTSEQAAEPAEVSKDPETPDVDEDEAVSIVFSGSSVSVDPAGDAVKAEGSAVTVRAAGTYLLSGSGSGSVTVKKETKDVVLVLSGLELNSDGSAAICCNKDTQVTILAEEGTVNTLADSEKNNDETCPNSETAENAVLKCKDGAQVLLCGEGTLNITANGKNGVKSGTSAGEAGLAVKDLTLNVTAVNDGIKSDAGLVLYSGSITVSAGDDGIGSDTSVTVGAQDAAGPTLTVSNCTEGIEAPQVRLLSGNVDICANDDGLNAVSETGTADITIAGGTVNIDAANGDGLDSNGAVNITGGEIRIFSSSRSDNSPLDYGTDMSITGGTVLAVGSSGMAQAPNIAAQTYVVFSAGNRIGGPQGSSEENSISFSLQQGDKLQILDESGSVLAEAEAPRQADYVFFTAPSLTDGQSCSLSVNSQSVGTAAATSELSAVGGIPDVGGNGGQPQMPGNFDPNNMPDGGSFDPNNLPEDFDPNNMPQRPDGGDFDPNSMPQRPDDGDFDPNSMPQRPDDGDFDPNNLPEDFDPNNMPQRPDGGNFDPGSMPQRPGGSDAQSGVTPDAGSGDGNNT